MHLWQNDCQTNQVECHNVFPQRYAYIYSIVVNIKFINKYGHNVDLRTMLHVQIRLKAWVKTIHVLSPQDEKSVEAFVVGRPALSLLSSFSKFVTYQYLEEIN